MTQIQFVRSRKVAAVGANRDASTSRGASGGGVEVKSAMAADAGAETAMSAGMVAGMVAEVPAATGTGTGTGAVAGAATAAGTGAGTARTTRARAASSIARKPRRVAAAQVAVTRAMPILRANCSARMSVASRPASREVDGADPHRFSALRRRGFSPLRRFAVRAEPA